jgi:hydroxymethylglutaryl-CoA synthase
MNQSTNIKNIGISGLAAYIPPYRVWLEDWCRWTDNQWPKVREVVGRSFRMRGPDQSVYTMAATAVMRLIEQYDVDPTRIKFLGLGTESSTDNSAGAIIVKGMVDRALEARGKPPIARSCEVPEFKHACLGGVYGMKGAIRHLALDGAGGQAIVVCADIAEYARGSSGEPTQGAGAVAMLLEEDPKLAIVDLPGSGSASDYRIMDFRKPMMRFWGQDRSETHQVQDYPVFNGKYSTTCYIDETLHALNDMYEKRGLNPAEYMRSLTTIFLHRPYRRMPETGWAVSYLFAMSRGNAEDRAELASYCYEVGIDPKMLKAEMLSKPNVPSLANPERLQYEAYPLTMAVLRVFRASRHYRREILDKLALGSGQPVHGGITGMDGGGLRASTGRRRLRTWRGSSNARIRQRRRRGGHSVLHGRWLARSRRRDRFRRRDAILHRSRRRAVHRAARRPQGERARLHSTK